MCKSKGLFTRILFIFKNFAINSYLLVGILSINNKGLNAVYGNICANECSEGTFLNRDTNTCDLYCDSSCGSCTSPNNNEVCTSCSSSTAFLL